MLNEKQFVKQKIINNNNNEYKKTTRGCFNIRVKTLCI